MASTRRRKSLNLIDQLQSEPHRFDFFQAVRLLEQAASDADQEDHFSTGNIGGLSRPDQESVHFSADPGLSFHGHDVLKVSQKRIYSRDTDEGSNLQWQMNVAMMGLTGSQGVLPYAYSEMLLGELRKKNQSLKDFFDLFNHRAISMFYEAWHKYQMVPEYERARRNGAKSSDLFTEAFLSIAGIGLSELRFRTAIPDESMARYAGHFGRPICSAESLRGAIEGMFGFDVTIDQFRGEWYELPEDVRCRLPDEDVPLGINNQLGVNTVIGTSCYQIQNKFGVVITPNSKEEFSALTPGSKTLEELKSFIKMSVGTEQDFEIEVRISGADACADAFFANEQGMGVLGWSTCIDPQKVNAESISIRLSQEIPTPVDALPMAY